jgi:hypothetical protein
VFHTKADGQEAQALTGDDFMNAVWDYMRRICEEERNAIETEVDDKRLRIHQSMRNHLRDFCRSQALRRGVKGASRGSTMSPGQYHSTVMDVLQRWTVPGLVIFVAVAVLWYCPSLLPLPYYGTVLG